MLTVAMTKGESPSRLSTRLEASYPPTTTRASWQAVQPTALRGKQDSRYLLLGPLPLMDRGTLMISTLKEIYDGKYICTSACTEVILGLEALYHHCKWLM